MNEKEWTRIPAPVLSDTDRRTLCAILVSMGLEVRIAKVKLTARGSIQRYVEFRPFPEV